MWIFLNDRFVAEQEAKISVFDAGFLYGDGLFETLLVHNAQVFALKAHLDRCTETAALLQIKVPSADWLETKLLETISRNHLDSGLLRLSISRGPIHSAMQPQLSTSITLVITPRRRTPPSKQHQGNGVSAQIVNTRRTTNTGQASAIKSLSFLNNILAKLEIDSKTEFEAILLTPQGFLAEGASSNLFWVKKNSLFTPRLDTAILPGITRKIVLNLAHKSGLNVREGQYSPENLHQSDEAFLTNSGIGVLPLTRLRSQIIGAGTVGPITQNLLKAYRKQVNIECPKDRQRG